jgi:hypothetical protein
VSFGLPTLNAGPEGVSREWHEDKAVWDVFSPRRGCRIQPRVSTLGNIQEKRFALKGRDIRWGQMRPIATEKGRGYLLGKDTISQWLK